MLTPIPKVLPRYGPWFIYSYSLTHYKVTYVRSGDTYNPDSAYKQKTVIAATNFASKFFLTGPLPIATHFSEPFHSAGIIARAPQWSPPPRFFSHPLLIIQGGLLDECEAGQLWKQCLRWRKSSGKNRYKHLTCLNSLLLQVLALSWRHHLANFLESFRNCHDKEWTGWGEKDKRRTGYAGPGGR